MAGAATAASIPTLSCAWSAPRLVFDARFPEARRLARAMRGDDKAVAVAGDPTALLAWPLGPGDVLEGVTPEAAPFCLAQALGARASLRSSRLDRDLFVWSITMAAE